MAAIQKSSNAKTRTGNKIIVTFGGIQVGLIQSVRMNDDFSPEAASGIGDIHVQEYVPTMARHSLSVSVMVLNAGALLKAGAAAQNGDDALQGLVFDFEVYSTPDGALLKKYMGCSYASGDTEVSKHSIVMQSGQFLALDTSGTAM